MAGFHNIAFMAVPLLLPASSTQNSPGSDSPPTSLRRSMEGLIKHRPAAQQGPLHKAPPPPQEALRTVSLLQPQAWGMLFVPGVTLLSPSLQCPLTRVAAAAVDSAPSLQVTCLAPFQAWGPWCIKATAYFFFFLNFILFCF